MSVKGKWIQGGKIWKVTDTTNPENNKVFKGENREVEAKEYIKKLRASYSKSKFIAYSPKTGKPTTFSGGFDEKKRAKDFIAIEQESLAKTARKDSAAQANLFDTNFSKLKDSRIELQDLIDKKESDDLVANPNIDKDIAAMTQRVSELEKVVYKDVEDIKIDKQISAKPRKKPRKSKWIMDRTSAISKELRILRDTIDPITKKNKLPEGVNPGALHPYAKAQALKEWDQEFEDYTKLPHDKLIKKSEQLWLVKPTIG